MSPIASGRYAGQMSRRTPKSRPCAKAICTSWTASSRRGTARGSRKRWPLCLVSFGGDPPPDLLYWSPLRGREQRVVAPPPSSRRSLEAPGSSDSLEGDGAVRRTPAKSFQCEVVSETVSVTLRRSTVIGGSGKLFVQCSELDCQYVGANEPPCPLTLDLFAAEIQERMEQRRDE